MVSSLYCLTRICDKGYANNDLFEYIDVLNEVSDICNKTASQYFVLGGDFNRLNKGYSPDKSFPFIC